MYVLNYCSQIVEPVRKNSKRENFLSSKNYLKRLLVLQNVACVLKGTESYVIYSTCVHRRSQERQGDHDPRKFLTYLVVLCFERLCPKQNISFKVKRFSPLKVLAWVPHCLWQVSRSQNLILLPNRTQLCDASVELFQ